MPSNDRKIVFNTRERVLSTDMNDMLSLIDANRANLALAMLTGDNYQQATERSGVVSGGIVTANGANLEVNISPVLAFKEGTPPGPYDSEYLKIESTAGITVDLTAFVDPGNPRWVAIELAPGKTPELTQARDIFQPALGTFTVASVTKVERPEPVVSIAAGAPSAVPQLPLGTSGVLPLAYIYIEAAAAAINPTDVILCRPLLQPVLQPEAYLQGRGGIDVPVQALGSYNVVPRNFAHRPQGRVTQVILGSPAINANVSPAASNYFLGDGFPGAGADSRVYAYLCDAPYPAGYDSDVAGIREFIDPSQRLPSNPVGFPFIANGLVVFSRLAPPNPAGPKGVPAPVSAELNDLSWNNGVVTSATYLGSFAYDDANTTLYAQRCLQQDTGEVLFIRDDVGGGTIDSVVGAVNNLVLNGRSTDIIGGSPDLVIPPHIRQILLRVRHSGPGGLGSITATLEESGGGDALFGEVYRNELGPGTGLGSYQVVPMWLDASGVFNAQNAAGLGTTGNLSLVYRGYLDSILALR